MTTRIATLDDLNAVRDAALKDLAVRLGQGKTSVTVHLGSCGLAAGARDVMAGLAAEMESQGVQDVILRQAGCAGLCAQEPMVTVRDASGAEIRYGKLDQAKAREIVREHVASGRPVTKYMIRA